MSSVLGTGRENNLRANYESEPFIVINRAINELSIDTIDMICTGNILKYIKSCYMKYINLVLGKVRDNNDILRVSKDRLVIVIA